MVDEQKREPTYCAECQFTHVPGEHVEVVFHEDAALNLKHFPKGSKVVVPKDYWLSEGHRHGTLVKAAEKVAVANEKADKEVEKVEADPPTVEDKHKVSPLHGGATHRKHLTKKGDA